MRSTGSSLQSTENTIDLRYVKALPRVLEAEYELPSIERTRLDNGIELVESCIPDRNAISIIMGSSIGSQNEVPELAGATHYCEHMLCSGTSTPGRESGIKIFELIEGVGGKVNAFTGKDRIALTAYAPRAHAALALDLVLDRAISPTFTPEALEQQRGAIVAEIAKRKTSLRARVFDKIDEVYFAGTSIAHPVLGYKENVQSFTREQLMQFHRAAFQPENLIVSVAGGYTPEFREILIDTLSAMQPLDIDEQFLIHEPSAIRTQELGEQNTFVETVANSGGVELALLYPGLEDAHEQEAALALLHTIIGSGSLTCRINAVLREQYGLTYGGGSTYQGYRDAGYQLFLAPIDPSDVRKALPILISIVNEVAENGITAEELNHAKSRIRAEQTLLCENMSSVSRDLLLRSLEAQSTGNPFVTPAEELDKLDEVTLAEVNALASQLLKPEDRLIFAAGDTTEKEILEALNL